MRWVICTKKIVNATGARQETSAEANHMFMRNKLDEH